MTEISLAEAEARFADLVDRVRNGETVEIVEDGQPIARLVPAETGWAKEDIERIRAFTDSLQFDPEPMESFIRRFRDDARY